MRKRKSNWHQLLFFLDSNLKRPVLCNKYTEGIKLCEKQILILRYYAEVISTIQKSDLLQHNKYRGKIQNFLSPKTKDIKQHKAHNLDDSQ